MPAEGRTQEEPQTVMEKSPEISLWATFVSWLGGSQEETKTTMQKASKESHCYPNLQRASEGLLGTF